MNDFSMVVVVASHNVFTLSAISKKHDIPVLFGDELYNDKGNLCCQVFSNSVENARRLKRIYTSHLSSPARYAI